VQIHRSLESVRPLLEGAKRSPAVLIGLCSHGLAILRSLVRKGVPVVVIESNWAQPSAQTRYGIKLHHPDLCGMSLLELLDDLGALGRPKPVLFVTNDRMVRLLNPHQEQLRRRYHLPFPRADLLSTLIEKDTLTPLAIGQGLRIPASETVSGGEARGEAPSAILDRTRFPCIVKPATPMSAIKALLPADRDALVRATRGHPEINRFIVQEWVPGGDERVHFVAYYFDREGRVRAPFVGQKIRQVPRTLGNSSAARGVDVPGLAEEGLKLFRGLDYRGIASVEFKLGPDGMPYFIEATVGRSDYWLKTLCVNGVDLPALVYQDLTGVALGAAERQRNRYAWVDGDRDVWVYLESWGDPSVSRARLIAQLFEPKRFALYDARDPRPYLAWCRQFAGQLAGAVGRRLFRRTRPATLAAAADPGSAPSRE
jgi:D-aspartate ligase